MALFQPTNVTPSNFNGTGTIDATENLDISWQVNGNSPMVAYQLVIMQNDTASTEKYDSGKITLSAPFYGVNSKGEAQFFSTEITAAQMEQAGIANGYEGGYKLRITQWWGSTDAQSISQTSASYFITRSKPTVTLTPVNPTFDEIRYTFTASYSQTEGDAMEWFRWQIEKDNGSWDEVFDSGRTFGATELQLTYEGFMPTSKYRVKCSVQTANGVEADTGWVEFRTWFNLGTTSEGNAKMLTCPQCDRDAVLVGVPKNMFVLGKHTGTYTTGKQSDGFGERYYITGGEGFHLQWDGGIRTTLNIQPGAYLLFYGVAGAPEENPQYPIIEFSSRSYSAGVFADSRGIYFKKGGKELFRTATNAYAGGKLAISIENTEIVLGYFENNQKVMEWGNLAAWQEEPIQSISFYGQNTIYFIYATSGIAYPTVQEVTGANYAGIYPPYTENTVFNYIPTGTFYTGGLNYEGTYQFQLYRRRPTEAVQTHIANFPIGFTQIYDYSAASQTQYLYSCYPIFKDTYKNYIIGSWRISNPVTPVFWNYTVITAHQDKGGFYHAISEYRFALDVGSGSTQNNNTPNLLQNFTKYPTRQGVSTNYRGGTLTAFIGKVANNAYVDNADLMKELYALSTSKLTKFLKTRKGDFMMIETAAPISMQIGDRYAAQPAKIALPWVEVGSTEGVSVIGGGMLTEAPYFYVDLVTGELIMLYNEEWVESNAFELDENNYLIMNDPGAYDADDYSLSSSGELLLRIPD